MISFLNGCKYLNSFGEVFALLSLYRLFCSLMRKICIDSCPIIASEATKTINIISPLSKKTGTNSFFKGSGFISELL